MSNRMFTTRLVCVAALAMTPIAAGQTFIEDDITEDTVWTADESPHIVVDQIAIANGATLTIEAGVSVRLSFEKTLIVGDPFGDPTSGTLVINGTPEAPVVFSGFGGSRDHWAAVWITELAVDATFDEGGAYTGGTKLEHTVFRWGSSSRAQFTAYAIEIDGSAPYLREVTVSDADGGGIGGRARAGAPLRFEGGSIDRFDFRIGVRISGLSDGSVVRGVHFGERVDGMDLGLEDGQTIIEDCTFTESEGSADGLLVFRGQCEECEPSVMIRDCVFEGRSRRRLEGGGMYVDGVAASLVNCVFIGCVTTERGGGLYAEDADVTIDGCRFEGNAADVAGGAIAVDGGRLTVTNSVFVDNNANDGGALYIRALDATLAGDPKQSVFNVFEGNTATRGSAVFNAVTGPDTDAAHVCWGTTDPDEIAAMIWDAEDNENLSFVLFDPPVEDCDAGCASDWNTDGVVNAADVGAYLTTYFQDILNGTINADFDENGVTNAADVGAFLSVYFPEVNDPACNGG